MSADKERRRSALASLEELATQGTMPDSYAWSVLAVLRLAAADASGALDALAQARLVGNRGYEPPHAVIDLW